MAEKEAKARIKINKLLEEAGWRFFDTEEGKARLQNKSLTSLVRILNILLMAMWIFSFWMRQAIHWLS